MMGWLGLPRAAATLALGNLLEHRLRSGVALAGIVFALFLALLQVGLLQAARKEATLLFEFFDFDLVLVSRDYQILYSAPGFDRSRLVQAKANPAVVDSAVLNIDRSHWTPADSDLRSSLLLIGFDRNPAFVADPALRQGLAALAGAGRGAVLADAYSHADYGPLAAGAKGRVGRREVTVAGLFRLGLFFYSEGAVIADLGDYLDLSGSGSRDIQFGLLRVAPGSDREALARQLAAQLPEDVRVLTRAALIAQERDYFTHVKPTGLMFFSGALIAVLVSAAIFMQVMSTDLLRRIPAYATLNALGFGAVFVHAVAGLQSLLFGLAGFLPAYLLAELAGRLVVSWTHLPLEFGVTTVFALCGLFLVVGGLSLATALHRLRRFEPAELFHA